MKKILMLMFFFCSMCLFAETWSEFRNRVEIMSDRVLVPKYFDSDGWLDNLAAVIATHDWCRKMYKYILENDNTMGKGERTGRELLQMLHEMKYKEFSDKAERLSPNSSDYVYNRYCYWLEHLKNGGWIKFRDMR
jgi:hypothetical protein